MTRLHFIVGIILSATLSFVAYQTFYASTTHDHTHDHSSHNHTHNHTHTSGKGGFCAQDDLYQKNPQLQLQQEVLEQQLLRAINSGYVGSNTRATYTIPVVLHSVSASAAGFTTLAEAQTTIQHLNDAFENVGVYNPATGVDVDIAFCLAQRDPSGSATNGITTRVSTLANLNHNTQDLALKNLVRWNPRDYLNVWVVDDIIGGVAGYAYLPSAHGSNFDGVVVEDNYIGSTTDNSKVMVHEVGHYLGLYHTFQAGCANNDCQTDNDRVCDTPPDNTTARPACGVAVNSCTTDENDISVNNPFRPIANGGIGDQPDQRENYMDYSSFSCYDRFTAGQRTRMQFFLTNTRASLLLSAGCSPACTSPINAAFVASATNPVALGTTVNFTNNTTNGTTYDWLINGTSFATTTNASYTFNTVGQYRIILEASNTDPNCMGKDTMIFNVVCPVSASFTYSRVQGAEGDSIVFTSTSTNSTTYSWIIDNVVVGNNPNLTYTFGTAGFYYVSLAASNGICTDTSVTRVITISQPPIANGNCVSRYQQTIGGPGNETAADVIPTLDGGLLVIGKSDSYSSNGIENGYITKLDENDNIQWSKVIDVDTTSFNSGLQNPDSTFVLVGAREFQNSSKQYVVKLDRQGNVIWSRMYTSTQRDAALSIKRARNGDYLVCGALDNYRDAGMMRIDATGNLLWRKSYHQTVREWFVDMVELSNGDIVAVGAIFGSQQDNLIAKMDANGQLKWIKSYRTPQNDGADRIIESKDGNLLLGGNSWDSNFFAGAVKSQLMKVDTAGNLLWSKLYGNVGNQMRIYALTQDSDSTIIMGLSDNVNDANFKVVRTTRTGDVIWGKEYGAINDYERLFRTKLLPNGSIVSVGEKNISGQFTNSIYIVKSDSLGLTGCAEQNYSPLTYVPTYTLTIPQFTTTTLGAGTPVPDTTRLVGSLQIIGCITPCDTNSTNGGACVNKYQQSIGGTGTDLAEDVIETHDGGVLIVGQSNSFGTTADGYIVKMDANDDIVWSRTIGGGATFASTENFYAGHQNRDSTFVLTGSTTTRNNVTQIYVVKIDRVGNVIWTRSYGSGTNNTGYDIIEASNGDYIVASRIDNLSDAGLLRIDALGNIIWHKRYNQTAREWFNELIELPNGDIVAGGSILNAQQDNLIVKTDANGQVIWSKRYSTPQNEGIDRIILSQDGNILLGGNSWSSATLPGVPKAQLMKIDTAGNVIWSKLYSSATNELRVYGLGENTDNTLIVGFRDNVANANFKIIKTDSLGNIIWGQQYGGVNSQEKLLRLRLLSNNTIVSVGIAANGVLGDTDIYVVKSDSMGITNCLDSIYNPQVFTPAYSIAAPSLTVTNLTNNTLLNHIATAVISSQSFNCANFCNTVEICNNGIDDDGDSLIDCADPDCCDTTYQVAITNSINNCQSESVFSINLPATLCSFDSVVWVNNGNGTIVNQNDTTLRLANTTAGNINMTVAVYTACKVSRDTFVGSVSPDTIAPIFIGNDTAVCENAVVTLRPGNQYASYLWQDNSIDSVYTVFLEGLYWVEVTDSCGNSTRDSIYVTIDSIALVDIADTVLCDMDTLALNLPNIYNYDWQGNTNINCTNCSNPKLYPTTTTTYEVLVSNNTGCFAVDSFVVSIGISSFTAVDTSTCATSVIYDGRTIAAGTADTIIYTNASGCDSLVRVNVISLGVNTSTTIDTTICTATLVYDGRTIAAGNSDTITYTSSIGCGDSVIIVNVNSGASLLTTVDTSTCANSLIYDGRTIGVGTTDTIIYINTSGCDSLVRVNVTSSSVNTSTTLDTTICGTSLVYDGRTIAAGTADTFVYTNSINCGDSVVIVNVSLGISLPTTITRSTCQDSLVYDGRSIAVGSNSVFNYTNVLGCDSMVTVNAVLDTIATSTIDTNICLGNTITYNGQTLTTGSTTTVVHTSSQGCDSTVIVQVNGLDTFRIFMDSTANGAITYNGQTVDTGTVTIFNLQTTAGCDSIVVFQLRGNTTAQLIGIPDAFTPNGDGVNDVFRPIGLTDDQILTFRVYNRFGQLVYNGDELSNQGWNGMYNGVTQARDVYVYVLIYELGTEEKTIRGRVTLLR